MTLLGHAVPASHLPRRVGNSAPSGDQVRTKPRELQTTV